MRAVVAMVFASIMLSSLLSIVQVDPNSNTVSQVIPIRINGRFIPHVPLGLGCYEFRDSTFAWTSKACDAQQDDATIPLLNEGGSYGVAGMQISANTVTYGYVAVSFSAYGGESDSSGCGGSCFSLQDNTNFYTYNGKTAWVQFAGQNSPNGCWGLCGWAKFGIWEWSDVNGGGLQRTLVDINHQGFNSNYHANVYADWYGQNGQYVLSTTFCDNANNCWGVNANDNVGLVGNWKTTSGMIFGIGNGSQANFGSGTSLSTQIIERWQGNYSPSAYTDYTTQEKNNLNQGTPSMSCSGQCVLTTPSSI